jgi:hypothetical protein
MQDEPVSPQQWQFQPEQPQPDEEQYSPVAEVPQVAWTASEFLAHQKNGGWYMILTGGAVVTSVLIYFLTRDMISSAVILMVAALLGAAAARKPRTLSYQLTNQGLHIGPKLYPYNDFKAFSVINEGAINSILLLPMKRFLPAVTVYYAPEDEQKILDVLSQALPYEQRDQDPIDRFMQRIRF